MEIINRIKAGAKVAPAFLIVLYYLLFLLDLFTSYLATPDMRYEGNLIVRFFHFNWSQFFLFYLLVVLIVTVALLVALSHIHLNFQKSPNFRKKLIFELFHNKKLFICLIVLGIFYSHIINLGHIIINNYLCYIYLFSKVNIFSRTSSYYITNQSLFLLYINIIPIILGYLIAIYKIKKIRNKYRFINDK